MALLRRTLVLALMALLLVGCGREPDRAVVYRVTGADGATTIGVAYKDRGATVDAQADPSLRNQAVPWTATATARRGDAISITAQNKTPGDVGTITCEVEIDGQVAMTQTDPFIAQCRLE